MCAVCNAKSLQLCLILCNPMDHSLLDSSVHGILQVRILEWVALLFFRGSSDLGMEPESLMSPALAGEFFFTIGTTWKAPDGTYDILNNQLSSIDFFSIVPCLGVFFLIHRVIYLVYQAWSFKLQRLKKNLTY